MINLTDELYKVGTLPPIGTVPKKMYAWTLRTERLGNPLTAFQEEIVDVPALKANEVLVANIFAGVNFNGIWAARGTPANVILSNGNFGDKREDFHICGSEASGIVYAVGENVTGFKPGDEVLLMGWRYDLDCPFIKNGGEPEYSPTYHIWGYEANWGAFSQFSKVADFQCLKKPAHMNWAEAAVCGATGTTVYRMLKHWKGNEIKPGDVVLIWGGSGGLGTSAIQQVKCFGGFPIAVVSDDAKGEFCKEIGAIGYINRQKFSHWGNISSLNPVEYNRWLLQATMFRNQIFTIIGDRISPMLVLEHPGSDTLPTSLFVCANGGMVVLCGATTGFIGSIDLRYLWMYQKRLQGSHAASREDCLQYIETTEKHGIKPLVEKIYAWEDLPAAHADMEKGQHKGKLAIQIVDPEDIPVML